MRALPFCFCFLLAAAPAFAGHNEVTYGGSERALRSSSADAVTAESLSGPAITYARSLDMQLMPKLRLWAEGSFAALDASGTLFQTMNSDVSTLTFTAGGRARYQPYRHLALSGRVEIGTARTELTLSQGDIRASDSGWGGIAVASVAGDLLAIDRPRFSFGVRAEAGYVAASPVGLTTTPEHDGDTLRLPTMQSSTGHLDLSGPFFGVSLVSQF